MEASMKNTFIILFITPALIVSLSCHNPFAPLLETGSTFQTCSDYKVIDNLLCSFRNAYAFKDTTLYGSLLAAGFTFSYTDYDRVVEVTWGRNDEMRSTYGLFQSVQSLSLVWNNEISSSGSDTLRSIIRGFNLTVTFNSSDISRVDGYANLTFERVSVNDPWKIIHWRDESNF